MKRASLRSVSFLWIALAGCTAGVGTEKGSNVDTGAFAVSNAGAADDPNNPLQGDIAWCAPTTAQLSKSLPYHGWALDTSGCDNVFVDLATKQKNKDLFVLLYEETAPGQLSVVDYNDDCYDGTLNACLSANLEAGTQYYVVATTFAYAAKRAPNAATYDLAVSCVNSSGECLTPATPKACGSRGLGPCSAGEYCDWDTDGTQNACGATDHAGVCTPNPGFCTKEGFPVCGCDGVTYGNPCTAHAAGTDIAFNGECEPQDLEPQGRGVGETCDGIASLQCAEGLVCDHSAHQSCYPDQAGVCAYQSLVLCAQVYEPECGCDGVTYPNDCARASQGVALDHEGECD